MQLNAAVDTKPNTPLEYPTNSVQEFHFLNLEVEKEISNNNNHGVWTPDEEIAELLEAGENGDSILNEGTGNPDEDIETFLFEDANKAAPDEYSLNNEGYHNVLFAHDLLHKGYINPNWILLNTGSSIDVFSNTQLMTNIHKSYQPMKIH